MMTKDGKFDEGLFFLMKIWHWADDHDLFLRKKIDFENLDLFIEMLQLWDCRIWSDESNDFSVE